MKSVLILAASLALMLAHQAVLANPELAKAKNCTACHAMATKLVGPSFKDIAEKYANDPNAEAVLVSKIKNGSSGVWGQVPMPPNAQVSEAEAHTLVKWILIKK